MTKKKSFGWESSVARGNASLNHEDLADLGEGQHFCMGKAEFLLFAECALSLPAILYLLMQFVPALWINLFNFLMLHVGLT